MAAMLERIREHAKLLGVEPAHVEGTPDSGWLLMDFGDVIFHLFSRALREFYHLERVWSEAHTVLHVM